MTMTVPRKSFSRLRSVLELPDLLEVQLKSFDEFLQPHTPPHKRKVQGLQEVFLNTFPITDSRENFILEFVEYYVEEPKYDVDECRERGMTYAATLKAKLRLTIKDEYGSHADTVEQVVYLGNLPYMTPYGTFIINGAERIVVSQLHRSPGVFFDELTHPSGLKVYSGRIIPLRGSWVEFVTDINDVMYVYIDRRRKFPVTTLLRAIGYSQDEDLLELFDLLETASLEDGKVQEILGRRVAGEVIDLETGELLMEREQTLTEEAIERLREAGIDEVKLIREFQPGEPDIITNTLRKDQARSEEDALEAIYRQLRSGEAPDLDTARQLLDRLFFNPKRYDLGLVGRYRINRKLGLNIPENKTVLTPEDIVGVVKYMIEMRNGLRGPDDVDHLGNRRVRTVGEQLSAQMSLALTRMARTIKERMNLRDSESLTPSELVNARTVVSVINTFFGTSQLSQFMDQTNPLAELTHKRRISALGPGGLTRERAGFEVRDVHYTHYGRLCPIETPEGPNIGLISSLTTYAQINDFGFIETPYRKVENGRVTDEIVYLSADEEENAIIAQANAPIDENGYFKADRIKARTRGEFPVVKPEEVNYVDVSPNQMVSAAAALIPFLEHDDANRALMGSNMQRQAVPLLRPEAPLVGTGLEAKVARDARAVVISDVDGVVEEVDSEHITIRREVDEGDESQRIQNLLDFDGRDRVTYNLVKWRRTNQDTCINQRPIVREGDRVKKGQVIADGFATDHGELALGRNVLVAFMPWRGYNFEDAIVISERLVKEDIYTSVHIEAFECQVRDTKRGEEELTREIPNVSEEATKDLDENGVIRVGAEVRAGDILVGKVTPKGETDPTPEEKLLRAIFGEKAGDVKDASLTAPSGLKGVVIDTKLFSRKRKDAKTKKQDKQKMEELERWYEDQLAAVQALRLEKMTKVLEGKKSVGIRDGVTGKTVVKAGTVLRPEHIARIDFDTYDYSKDLVDDEEANELVRAIQARYKQKLESLQEEYNHRKLRINIGDELPPGIVQMAKVYVAKRRKIMIGDKMAGRHGNKGVVATIVPEEDMPYLEDGTPVDIVLNPLGVPSRMNLGQILETTLGWAARRLGVRYATPVFDGATEEEVKEEMRKAGLPVDGKVTLYDGRTGEPFEMPVTVGYIYMMKLSHLVEDKIHARSIGPYSLITQQPLGGKAQFGGQRFGEMEVWALEAYGASHTLQEILTVKSDDVRGRAKVYEAIVRGENLPEPGLPESFNVLIKELQGLALDVELLDATYDKPKKKS